MSDKELASQLKIKEIRDRIEKLKHFSDDYAVETRQALEEELSVLEGAVPSSSTQQPVGNEQIKEENPKTEAEQIKAVKVTQTSNLSPSCKPSKSRKTPALATPMFSANLSHAPQKSKEKTNAVSTVIGIVLLGGIIGFSCYYFSPSQRALRELQSLGVNLGSDVNEEINARPNLKAYERFGLALGSNNIYTPLYRAVDGKRTKIVKLLIQAGADVNKTSTEHGFTPLLRAVSSGQIEVIKLLIEAGADVDKADADGDTPLHCAARRGRPDLAKLLIEAGANFSIVRVNGASFLSWSIQSGDTELTKMLIERSANVNEVVRVSRNGMPWGESMPLLCWTAQEGRTEVVKLLIEAGADVNKASEYGSTPLRYAANKGCTEIVKLLIEAGADVNKANKDGDTPLRAATKEGHTEVAKLLVEAGADVNKSNPLIFAVCSMRLKIVLLLIEAGAGVNGIDSDGLTPLHYAVMGRNQELMKWLIEAGADVNKADKRGRTPLDVAIKSRGPAVTTKQIVELLKAAGAK